VLKKVGIPLSYTPISSNGAGATNVWFRVHSAKEAREGVEEAGGCAILRYSEPVGNSSYHAYEVWILSNVVAEIHQYTYWD
jgi:hypothetical protein